MKMLNLGAVYVPADDEDIRPHCEWETELACGTATLRLGTHHGRPVALVECGEDAFLVGIEEPGMHGFEDCGTLGPEDLLPDGAASARV